MQNVIDFLMAHLTVFAALGVAILDAIFGFNPNLQSNGILHWLYLFLTGKKSQ